MWEYRWISCECVKLNNKLSIGYVVGSTDLTSNIDRSIRWNWNTILCIKFTTLEVSGINFNFLGDYEYEIRVVTWMSSNTICTERQEVRKQIPGVRNHDDNHSGVFNLDIHMSLYTVRGVKVLSINIKIEIPSVGATLVRGDTLHHSRKMSYKSPWNQTGVFFRFSSFFLLYRTRG